MTKITCPNTNAAATGPNNGDLDIAATECNTGTSAAPDNADSEQQFRILMLAHAMSVEERLARMEAALAETRLMTAEAAIRDVIAGLPKDKGGRPRDAYPDFLTDLNPAQREAAERATEKVLALCQDIPPEHVERVLVTFVGAFYDVQTASLRARAEARYRTKRRSANPKAALTKALQRHRQ